MLFAEGPANTVNYFIAGYTVFFTVMIVYLASLLVRWRNLKKDLEVLHEVEQRDEPGS
jgi:hypothetical protein